MANTAVRAPEEFPVKLTIERNVLLKSLSRLQSIVEKRNTIPILSNIKLDASGAGLHLTATDMDLVATETVPAQIEGGGSLTIPAQTFFDIIRKLPEGTQVELDTDASSTQLIIQTEVAQFKLSYLPASDFPVMSEGELTHDFEMQGDDLLRLLDKARFAMSTEETRYYLNGIYFHVAENSTGDELLKAVATDGHRLSRLETALPEGASGMPGVIIPRKTVTELTKCLADFGEGVKIALSDSKIRFQLGDVVLLSKLVDGTFPDYMRVIPQNNEHVMEVDAKGFTQAVDRVSTISTEKTRGIKCHLNEGELTLSAQSPEAGTAKERLSVSYSGDVIEIGFNSRYMLEMMSQLDGDTAQFRFADSNAPALVTDPSDVSALYVIMPMRV